MSTKRELISSGSGDAFKFANKGDKLTGIYLGYEEAKNSKFGPQLMHKFKTEEGLKLVYNKTQGQLADLLSQVEPGQLVDVIFDRTKDTGKGNPMKIYRVLVDPDFVADPADIEAATAGNTYEDEEYAEVEPVTATVKARPNATPVNGAKQAEIQARLANRVRTG